MIARSRRRWEPISFCAERGMTDERAADQAQYLVSWLSILKSDKKGGGRRGIEGVGSRIVFSVAERQLFAA